MSENSPKTKLQLRKDLDELEANYKTLSYALYNLNMEFIKEMDVLKLDIENYKSELKKYEDANIQQ